MTYPTIIIIRLLPTITRLLKIAIDACHHHPYARKNYPFLRYDHPVLIIFSHFRIIRHQGAAHQLTK